MSTHSKYSSLTHIDTRLKWGLTINLAPVIGNSGNIQVIDKHNLITALERFGNVIIAPSHVTDVDVQIAARALLDVVDPLITARSTHKDDWFTEIGMRFIGLNHFAYIFWTRQKNDSSRFSLFNPEDYEIIKTKAAREKKTPIVAAHNPTYDGYLPKNGGIANVYLSHLMGVPVIPAAVWIDRNDDQPQPGLMKDFGTIVRNLGNRPYGHLAIGKPIMFEPVDVSPIKVMGAHFENKSEASREDIARYDEVLQTLRVQSNRVLDAIKSMIPKRHWLINDTK